MNTVRRLFRNPKVRLALRAVVAGAAVVVTRWQGGDHNWQALEVAAILAAAEVFTPLNPIVGFLKGLAKPAPRP